MIFNLNRKGRNADELDKFIALFCCTNISIYSSLLFAANDYIKISDNPLLFLDAIINLSEKILSIRRYLYGMFRKHPSPSEPSTDNAVSNGIIEELEDSSSIIIALLRKDEPYISITEPTLAMEFSQKIKPFFASPASWTYTDKIERRKSIQELFRNLLQSALDNAAFPATDDIRDPSDISFLSLMESDIDTARRLLYT